MKKPEYLAINPMGKVPAIVHDGQVVTEVAAICAYLAEAFPQAGLAPTPSERAAYYRWLFFAAGPIESAVVNNRLGFTIPPERKGMVGYGSYDDAIAALELRLQASPYIAGDRISPRPMSIPAVADRLGHDVRDHARRALPSPPIGNGSRTARPGNAGIAKDQG